VDIKSKRLEWLGHVIKMDQTRVAVTIWKQVNGTRKVGSIGMRWLGAIQNNLLVLKVEKGKILQKNRHLTKEVTVSKGL
jgi:hypothetical protein